jgi:hypothetical protein
LPVVRDLSTLKGKRKWYGKAQGAGMGWRAPLGKMLAAIGLALIGATVRIIFAPDPAAAAGAADLQFRVIGAARSVPRSERPVYLGLLALAGLMCAPLLSMLFKILRRPSIPVAGW